MRISHETKTGESKGDSGTIIEKMGRQGRPVVILFLMIYVGSQDAGVFVYLAG